MGKSKTLTSAFTGILTPSDWDEHGNIKGISLQTIDENEYLIEKNKLETELRLLLNERVELKGKVRERIDGKKSLVVQDYKRIISYNGKSI